MTYREARLNYENVYELRDDQLIIRVRTWPTFEQERTIDLRALDPNVTRQRQRDQWLKRTLVTLCILGIGGTIAWALAKRDALVDHPTWLMPVLIGGFLVVGLLAFVHPFREEYVLFNN